MTFFAFANQDLGRAVHLSNIVRVVQEVPGVIAADVNVLQFKESTAAFAHGATSDPVQNHLRIFSNEIAAVNDEFGDVLISAELS